MENYVVRVYRRNADDPDGVVGLIEQVEKAQTRSFRTLTELISILSVDPDGAEPQASRRIAAARLCVSQPQALNRGGKAEHTLRVGNRKGRKG